MLAVRPSSSRPFVGVTVAVAAGVRRVAAMEEEKHQEEQECCRVETRGFRHWGFPKP